MGASEYNRRGRAGAERRGAHPLEWHREGDRPAMRTRWAVCASMDSTGGAGRSRDGVAFSGRVSGRRRAAVKRDDPAHSGRAAGTPSFTLSVGWLGRGPRRTAGDGRLSGGGGGGAEREHWPRRRSMYIAPLHPSAVSRFREQRTVRRAFAQSGATRPAPRSPVDMPITPNLPSPNSRSAPSRVRARVRSSIQESWRHRPRAARMSDC